MVKQVIVMRTRYEDKDGGSRKLRRGKEIAQGSHASMAWLTTRIRNSMADDGSLLLFNAEETEWLTGPFTKIVLGVETEAELLELYEKAQAQELTVHLITDSGATEFDGVPTNTCLAIGPHEADRIDPITSDLKLL